MIDVVVRPDSFAVLLPVKSPGTAKSRLSSLPDEERRRVAAAFATDVVEACRSTPEVALVLVISDDAEFTATLRAPEVTDCPDPGAGLNAALRYGAAILRDAHPDLQPVALCADLPALKGADLGAALAHAVRTARPCFVQDAAGTGTTLYTAPYDDFDPRFGIGSAAAHRATGAVAVPGELATLRQDVDDIADLTAAVALGIGAATARALAAVPLRGAVVPESTGSLGDCPRS